MKNLTPHLKNILISALGYGFGFVVTAGFSALLLRSGLLEPVRDMFAAGKLITGITLIVATLALAGALGGAVGGWALSYATPNAHRQSYAWRSAIAFAVSFALVLYPLIILVAMFSFYNAAESSPIGLMLIVSFVGLLFGATSGIILGILTVGRNAWRIFFYTVIGFALGGAALGYWLWMYLFANNARQESVWALFVGMFLMGAIGGGALGYKYSWLARRKPGPGFFARTVTKISTLKSGYRFAAIGAIAILALIIIRLWTISPFKATSATLDSILESRTSGTHWTQPVNLVDAFKLDAGASSPVLAANNTGSTAIAWVQGQDIYYTARYLSATKLTLPEPVNISNSANTPSTSPQLVIDSLNRIHIVWTEKTKEGNKIFYSQCRQQTCSPPVPLSALSGPKCAAGSSAKTATFPALAISRDDVLMATWIADEQTLIFSTWPTATPPPKEATGCVPTRKGTSAVWQPRLAGGLDDTFSLVFERNNSEIDISHYTNSTWEIAPEPVGAGHGPEVWIDPDNQLHVAWCGPDTKPSYQTPAGQTEQLPLPGCVNRPGLLQNSDGVPRLIWYTNQIKNSAGVMHPNTLLVESIRENEIWSEPAIISKTGEPTQPTATIAGDGTSFIAWNNKDALVYMALHTEYSCDESTLTPIGQTVFNTLNQDKFHPAASIIPFCHNQYQGLVFAPNPNPAFSRETPVADGGFAKFSQLAKTAQYEVVFATMWYNTDINHDSPGSLLAQSIAELYHNLKTNPSRYPKGLTVRILLGNPPEPVIFPMLHHQIRKALDDLRAAGITEMENLDIGWKLEVANFDGSWPHSHTKLMVVDGKSAIAVGFNMAYEHYPKEHLSGMGHGRVDLGVQATGPVAQASLRAFDDLWDGSNTVHCTNFNPDASFLWILSCSGGTATATHVPEVMKYFIAPSNANAFSLYRSTAYNGADEVYAQALASATESIDIIQVNFALQMVCDLGVLLEVCTYANRLEYMDALMKAVDNNHAKLRILIEEGPIDGIENNIAIKVFREELEARGLSELVEFRYFNGDVHVKAALIDQEFLVVGSQNYHYSAWGKGGLTEYSLGLDDPQAVDDYQKMFDYYWKLGAKVE